MTAYRQWALARPDLRLLVPFDDAATGATSDLGGGGDATYDGATPVAGYEGGALNFDGVDDRLVAPGAAGHGADWTMAYWMWLPLGQAGQTRLQWAMGQDVASQGIYCSMTYSAGWAVQLQGVASWGASSTVVAETNMPTEEWHFITITAAEVGTGTSDLSVYMDGAHVHTASSALYEPDPATALAWCHYGNAALFPSTLDHRLDELLMLDSVLDAAEVAALYDLTQAPAVETPSNLQVAPEGAGLRQTWDGADSPFILRRDTFVGEGSP